MQPPIFARPSIESVSTGLRNEDSHSELLGVCLDWKHQFFVDWIQSSIRYM